MSAPSSPGSSHDGPFPGNDAGEDDDIAFDCTHCGRACFQLCVTCNENACWACASSCDVCDDTSCLACSNYCNSCPLRWCITHGEDRTVKCVVCKDSVCVSCCSVCPCCKGKFCLPCKTDADKKTGACGVCVKAKKQRMMALMIGLF